MKLSLLIVCGAVGLVYHLGWCKVDEGHHEVKDHGKGHKSSEHHHKWDYTKEGQAGWHHHHADCGGEVQSPIRISTRHAMPAPYPALEMVGYHNPLPQPITITNNGHSVSLSPGAVTDEEDHELPYIFGGPLKGEFEMVSLHFHWGRKNNRGSEHIINSIRYAMEMHIIHRNRKYATLSEALQHPDGVAVIAFFFQAGERHNARLDTVLRSLPHVRHAADTTQLDTPLALAWLQPRDIDTFYSYRGSLTTPPCSEAVTWLLFPSALHVSFDQMLLFRRLSNGEEPLVDNFRFPQPLYGRVIYVHRLQVLPNSTRHTNGHHQHGNGHAKKHHVPSS